MILWVLDWCYHWFLCKRLAVVIRFCFLFCYELYKKSISVIRSDLFRIFIVLEALRRIVFWFQLGDYELLGDAAMTINHIHGWINFSFFRLISSFNLRCLDYFVLYCFLFRNFLLFTGSLPSHVWVTHCVLRTDCSAVSECRTGTGADTVRADAPRANRDASLHEVGRSRRENPHNNPHNSRNFLKRNLLDFSFFFSPTSPQFLDIFGSTFSRFRKTVSGVEGSAGMFPIFNC